jgi:deoxycytidine triphosphate deaminase
MSEFRTKEEFYIYAKQQISKDDNDAENRYNLFKSKDPFPDIPSALLNSKDIFKYVATTGMIHPFYPEDLKGATYDVRINGKAIYWNEKGKKINIDFSKNKLIFPKNTIVFIELEPIFRIPDYIALRFNLSIDNIYKGLLLGTGPIVDPGFVGKLYIPLHNLTMNQYIFEKGGKLIRMEFTKLSQNVRWDNEVNDQKNSDLKGYYIEFDKDKWNRELQKYIEDALKEKVDETGEKSKVEEIRNSIPETIKIANKLNNEWNNFKKNFIRTGITVIVIAIITLLFAVVWPSINLVQETRRETQGYHKTINEMITDYKDLKLEVKILLNQNDELKDKIKNLSTELDENKSTKEKE